MKTLENQTLIYDADCPLCRSYTSAFVKTGMLDENGRTSFCMINQSKMDYVDFKRASNEIALIDHTNKTVTYGVDSLLKVIGNSFPALKKFATLQPVYFLLRKMYAFISYNRKVIIPGKPNDGNTIQCVPDFNYTFRMAYLLMAIWLTALVLNAYAVKLSLIPGGGFIRELILAFGQLLFQGIFLYKREAKTFFTYAGNLMTVSLMGAMLLMPMLLVNTFIKIPEIILLGWFGLTALLMFLEHFRRVHLLKLPTFLSFTWVLYRLIALLFILNL